MAFPVSGTVAAVDVAVGDTVAVGHRLAALDGADLQATVRARQADLDRAELVLEKALAGEDVSGLAGGSAGTGGTTGGSGSAPTGISSTSSTGSSSTLSSSTLSTSAAVASTSGSSSTSGTLRTVSLAQDATGSDALPASAGAVTAVDDPTATTPSTTTPSTTTPSTTTASGATAPDSGAEAGGATTVTDEALRAAQQRVLDAQRTADEALARADAALQGAVEACAAAAGGAPDDSTGDQAGGTDGGGVAGCSAALQAVLAAQREVATAQQEVTDASAAYTTLLKAWAAGDGTDGTDDEGTTPDSGGTGSTTPDSGDTDFSSGSTTGSTSGSTTGSDTATDGSASSGSSAPSAGDLVAYQKAVDAAAARLAVAEQAVAQATIVSPIAGTVVAVGLEAGDEVTGGSATATVVVVGDGGYEVTTTVAVTDLPDVEVGQAATVVPDGATAAVVGEVVRIGVATTADTGSTTYPVVIGLTGDTTALGNGATASVSIVTDQAEDALAVPTSAITTTAGTDGPSYTVRLVADGEATEQTVEIGAMGATWTAVTSGLEAGDQVVLADLDQPLPGTATEASTTGRGDGTGQGGQAGQGGPPSGMPAGGPPAGFPGGN